jgi:hypothetical protein
VKLVRVLSRLALLLLAAAAFAVLTAIYVGSVRTVPDSSSKAERQHRPAAPRVNLFLEFIGEGMLLALYAFAGRIVFRLRLSPVPRSEGKPIALDLHRSLKALLPPSVALLHR